MEQAVILCGGKGTRLGAEFSHLPKPLVPVLGVPLLDRIIQVAAESGVREVILAAGHLGELIERHYADGHAAPVNVRVVREDQPLGTAGCLLPLASLLREDFFLLYGDVFLDIDLKAISSVHERERPVATLLVRQSDHPMDSDLVALASDGVTVDGLLPKATRSQTEHHRNCANAAVYACSRRLLDFVPADRPSDIATDVFPAVLASGGRLVATWLPETAFVKDMGTPARLGTVEQYCRRRGLVAESLRAPKPLAAVILDRDGVLVENLEPRRPSDPLELLPGVAEALAALNRAGLRCYVATNQPWIARGLVSEADVDLVHRRLSELVAASGGRIDEIIHCPNHPETHHGEGILSLRCASENRKPRPGMLFALMERHGFTPAEVAMVGDSRADILAGRNGGVRTVLVGGDAEAACEGPELQVPTLLDAVPALLAWKNTHSLP